MAAATFPPPAGINGPFENSFLLSALDTFDQEKALAGLREEIKGREEEPAGEVFKNIKIMKDMPAGRLLRVMEMGFGGSLGVTCDHCHNPDDWASEEKNAKQITRDMWAMVGRINGELLKSIPNLEGPNPSVNCTTCTAAR